MEVIWLAIAAVASATTMRATVEVGPEGPVVIDLVEATVSPSFVPVGPLAITDDKGNVLSTAAVPDPRLRSIITPEGGEAAWMDTGRIQVLVDWPEGATTATLSGRSIRPRSASPPPPTSGVTLIQEAGPSDSRLDLVFLGDGYRQGEMDKFHDDVDWIVDYLQGIEPYADYATLFNIWRVDTPSNESGGDHPEGSPATFVDTALDCTYDCANIERLICCDDTAVMNLVLSTVPDAEGVLVLVNDDVYGGSGGFNFAVSFTGQGEGRQVAAHELGHSLVGLWDEYGYGTTGSPGDEGPNCSGTQDPHWTEWVGTDGVDSFQECSYSTHYRPTSNECMMRSLSDDYCPVCRQEVVRAMYSRIPGIVETTTPAVGETVTDGVEITAVIPNGRLTFEWWLNGELVSDSERFDTPCGSKGGELMLTVRDETSYVRADPDGLLEHEVGPWTVPARECDAVDELAELCGCSTAGGLGSSWLFLPMLALGLRRRE